MMGLKFTELFLSQVQANKRIIGARFHGNHMVEFFFQDTRFPEVEQTILTRDQLLGYFPETKKQSTNEQY